jgi:hypothetical protein
LSKTPPLPSYSAAMATRRQKHDALMGTSVRATARSSLGLIRAASTFSPRRVRHSCSPCSDHRLSGCWQARLSLPSSGVYLVYVIHNFHFAIYGSMFLGQYQPAIAAAEELIASVPRGCAAH